MKSQFFWGFIQAVYIRKFSIFVLSSKINIFWFEEYWKPANPFCGKNAQNLKR